MPGLLHPEPSLEWNGRLLVPDAIERDGFALRASFGDRGEIVDRVVEGAHDGDIGAVHDALRWWWARLPSPLRIDRWAARRPGGRSTRTSRG